MARLRYNGLSTTLGVPGLTSSATAVTFGAALTHSGGTNVPTITGTDYVPLSILDVAGKVSEIVYLIAYTAGATTGTLARGQEGTAGVAHSSGDRAVHGPTVEDISTGGGGWNSRFAEAGDSLANWTTGGTGGTWTVASGVLHCVHSGTLPSRLRHNVKLPTGMVAMQADIRLTAGGTQNDARAGLIIGFNGTASGGILVRLHADNSATGDGVQTEVDTTSAKMSTTMAWGAVNTWHTLRVVTGGGISTAYVDGTLIHSAGNNVQQSNDATYVGLLAGDCTAEFRNITAWSPRLPWE